MIEDIKTKIQDTARLYKSGAITEIEMERIISILCDSLATKVENKVYKEVVETLQRSK